MSKSRNRQLARQHARRQAERRAQQRRRATAIAVAAVIAVAGIGFAAWAFWPNDEGEPAASATPSASPSATGPTGPTGPTGKPGEQTGTVEPTAGPQEVACGAEVPKGAMDPKPQFAAPAKVIEKSQTYVATLQTSCGDIVIELLDDQAPKTVNSFVFLAQEGFFDGQRIHRIDESIDVLQGGDPTGTGGGGPGYTIPDELTGKESYAAGTFAMANAGPDTGGSQFFIITGVDGHALDEPAAWTIFGTVIEGLDVAEEIQGIPISDPDAAAAGDLTGQQPSQAVYIERVTIATK
ncbi:MAG TPA: peptidylprolyl isomerase [Actinomycetota bacterium]|nr:peptidylprolyl isomerase [Actinomycetota bacterium]